MTPREYMNRYLNLEVRQKDGTTVTVTVDQYRRGDWGRDGAENWAIAHRLRTKGVDEGVVLQVGKEKINIERHNQMDTKGKKWEVLASLPFWGKGSPEQCQLVLQPADHWGRARKGLQAYAKNRLLVTRDAEERLLSDKSYINPRARDFFLDVFQFIHDQCTAISGDIAPSAIRAGASMQHGVTFHPDYPIILRRPHNDHMHFQLGQAIHKK